MGERKGNAEARRGTEASVCLCQVPSPPVSGGRHCCPMMGGGVQFPGHKIPINPLITSFTGEGETAGTPTGAAWP